MNNEIFKELCKKQKELDSVIFTNSGVLQKDIIEEEYLAVMTEISELANETACFKYWKRNHEKNQDNVKQEVVDVLHFLLSIANYHKLEDAVYPLPAPKLGIRNNKLTTNLLDLLYAVNALRYNTYSNIQIRLELIQRAFSLFEEVCYKLRISNEELVKTYYSKVNINLERVSSGY